MRTVSVFLLGLLCVVVASPAGAQVRPYSVEASVFSGAWEGDEVLDTAPTFGARAQFNLSRVIGLEAVYGLVPTTHKKYSADAANPTSTQDDATVQQASLNAVLHLSDSALTPFITVGAGFVHVDSTDFASDLGLGAKYYFNDIVAARLDVRGWFSGDAPAQDEFAHFELTGGVSIQLGGDADIDNDGVLNADDKCVSTPEDRDGFKDDDGCPDPDNDGDGIEDATDKCLDVAEDADGDRDDDGCPDLDDDGDGFLNDVDKCPAEAEDKDGFEDEDGCPDPDNDGDGIEDAQDKCPTEPELKNGVADDDGCPEKDTDGDSFFDEQDKCPDKAENQNGIEDEDGCPDELPEDLRAVLGINAEIRFAKGSKKIGPAGRKQLEPVAEVLARYPKIAIGVGATCHGEKDNDDVSRQRAESVIAVLVDKGVDAGRLRAKALGAAPLPGDAPKTARKDRVEFSVENP